MIGKDSVYNQKIPRLPVIERLGSNFEPLVEETWMEGALVVKYI